MWFLELRNRNCRMCSEKLAEDVKKRKSTKISNLKSPAPPVTDKYSLLPQIYLSIISQCKCFPAIWKTSLTIWGSKQRWSDEQGLCCKFICGGKKSHVFTQHTNASATAQIISASPSIQSRRDTFHRIDILGVILKDGDWFIHTHPSTDRSPELARMRIPPLCECTHTHGHRFPQSLHADTRTDTHAAVFPIISSSPPSSTRHPFSVPLQLHVEGFNPGDTTLLLKERKRRDEEK